MKILVTGGAGYVGSHVLRELIASGHDAVVFDNLCNGHREAVGDVDLVEGDILDEEILAKVFERDAFDCVMHLCALTEAGRSVVRPDEFHRVNVVGGLNLLDAMLRADVKRIVFSSTAAVYGNPERVPIDETHPTAPISPYGAGKLAFERMLEDYQRAFGMGVMSLRYFNAAGADASGEIGEAHPSETHLIPLILRAALGGEAFTIFGDDYDTPDGTAIRDYVHVSDLAAAHVLALDALEEGASRVYNIGSAAGNSVREVLEVARRVTGCDIPAALGPRRKGDPARLVASADLISRELGWKPRHADITDIVQSAWNWHRTHPNGFDNADSPAL